MNLFDIRGRTAVVIGGTTGIGREIALGLRDAGAYTVAAGRRVDFELASALQVEGHQPVSISCDITDRQQIDSLRDAVVGGFGGVDILLNCAGRTFRAPTAEMGESEWSSLIDTNLTGMLRTCQAFYETLKSSRAGRIVNIASLASFMPFQEVAAYSASKAGVIALTRSLGAEWAKDGIRTNAIVPGVFLTDLNRELLENTSRGRELLARTPLGRFGQINELVGAALFLSSDAASFITGADIVVDGGFLASGVNS